MEHRRPHQPPKRPDWEPSPTPTAVGAVAGLVGGLIGSWLMVEFQRRIWPPPSGDGGTTSTSRLVRRLAEPFRDELLPDQQAATAGTWVHYGLGAGLGAFYVATADIIPSITSGAGLAFGAATELVIDQGIVPALGLSRPFWKCPPEWHARGLAAHLVFGLAVDASRKLLLSATRDSGSAASVARHRRGSIRPCSMRLLGAVSAER